jgi:hypothetical protein
MSRIDHLAMRTRSLTRSSCRMGSRFNPESANTFLAIALSITGIAIGPTLRPTAWRDLALALQDPPIG